MHIALRERDLNAVGAEGVVNALQDIAHDIGLLGSIGPHKEVEVDAGVVHLGDYRLNRLRGIHPLVVQVVDGILH